MAHGDWLPWLKTNADKLGFESPRTAQRLMDFTKFVVNDEFDLWGEYAARRLS
jgi:hypothetical protein